MSIIKPKEKIQNLQQPCHEHKVSSKESRFKFDLPPMWWESDWVFRIVTAGFLAFILATLYFANS